MEYEQDPIILYVVPFFFDNVALQDGRLYKHLCTTLWLEEKSEFKKNAYIHSMRNEDIA